MVHRLIYIILHNNSGYKYHMQLYYTERYQRARVERLRDVIRARAGEAAQALGRADQPVVREYRLKMVRRLSDVVGCVDNERAGRDLSEVSLPIQALQQHTQGALVVWPVVEDINQVALDDSLV